VVVPEEGLAERGAAYWAELIANPTFAVYRAVKP
jgi:hypothetical protein